ncbi:MAG: pseudouridine synthase [Clostridium sp.]|nr:pseudouridine synthase [Clostridium sp.]
MGKDREETEGVRLNKYLGASGVCSRRDADKLIEDGKVTVDGVRATLGTRVLPGQVVICDGREVSGKDKPVLLAVNKPRGIVCTTSDRDRAQNIVDFLNYPIRIYPVGRLDKDSDGLILMTNEGALVNRILRARYMHEKEYVATVDKPVTEEFIRQMRAGVDIGDAVTRPCKVIRMGDRSFRIVLTQGLNRQIRRMCETLGYHVRTLKRIRIMNIRLGNLERGKYREIAGEEYDELMRLLDAQPDTEHETGSPDIYERAERRSNAMAKAPDGHGEAGAGSRSFRGSTNGRSARSNAMAAGRDNHAEADERSRSFRSSANGGSGSFRSSSDSRNGRTGADGRIARTGAAPRDEKTTAARFENQKVSAEGQKSHLNKAHRISIARRPKPEEE